MKINIIIIQLLMVLSVYAGSNIPITIHDNIKISKNDIIDIQYLAENIINRRIMGISIEMVGHPCIAEGAIVLYQPEYIDNNYRISYEITIFHDSQVYKNDTIIMKKNKWSIYNKWINNHVTRLFIINKDSIFLNQPDNLSYSKIDSALHYLSNSINVYKLSNVTFYHDNLKNENRIEFYSRENKYGGNVYIIDLDNNMRIQKYRFGGKWGM
jgi:hypothetical protein